jgi:DNA-binding transcriptional LysR family regulator/predicted ATPase
MELEPRVRAFAAVARTGSFSRAGAELYVSQPAVSKSVASLEAELGQKLLVRTRQGATLTPAGQLLADYVHRAEALLANARRALHAHDDAGSGTLSLAASGIPGTYLLPALLARFREDRPGVEVDFRVNNSASALELVRAHAVELAVVGGLEVPAELEAEALVEDEVVLIGPPSLAGRRLRATELERQTWISREEGSSTRAAVEVARWEMGLHAVRELELPSWEAVKLAVAQGAGIAAISRLALGIELAAGALAVLDVPRWRLTRTIAVVRARDVPLTAPAERFLSLLRDTYRTPEEASLPANSNLSLPDATLFGRRTELAELSALLTRKPGGLVTLTGTAGVGKTRLALETASRLVHDFRDGVYFVDLSPLPDPSHLRSAVAGVLGIRRPNELVHRLRDAQMLLVLDNFEHLIDAAGDLADLRREASAVTMLVTSRTPLRVRGERTFDLEPLPQREAVELFVDRARDTDHGFRPDDSVPLLCERLDRLPLALELVAARVGRLPPTSLLDGLHPVLARLERRDAPKRQRTLTAAIGWSYDLLDDRTQATFRRLSVFSSGWTIDGAVAVCEAEPDTIARLVEHNLVVRGPEGTRFRMLETIREFALERLAERGEEDELRRRLAEHVLALADRAREGLAGNDRPEWLRRVDADLANVRAALRWAEERQDFEYQLRVTSALAEFWLARGPAHEILQTLRTALEHVETPTSRADALKLYSWVLRGTGDLARARDAAQERRRLSEQLGDVPGVVGSIDILAGVAEHSGDLELAEALLEEAAQLGLQVGSQHELANLSGFLLRRGELERGKALFEELQRRARDQGDVHLEAHVRADLSGVVLLEGRFDEALPLLQADVRTWHELGDLRVLAYCLTWVAFAYGALGHAETGATIAAAAEAIAERIEIPLIDLIPVEAYEQAIAALDPAVLEKARRRGAALTAEEAVELALSLEN